MDRRPRGLILESAFTSVPVVAAHHYRFLPVRLLSRFKYSTVEYIRKVTCPILIIHSRDDEIVPCKFGRRLLAAAPPQKRFLELVGDHNSGYLASGDTYTRGLADFLAETGVGRGQ